MTQAEIKVSPRLRGWTFRMALGLDPNRGLPAPAGMDPTCPPRGRAADRSPRACGDGPVRRATPSRADAVSPRLRGWTRSAAVPAHGHQGLPAPAGMDPHSVTRGIWNIRSPRACGDGPDPMILTDAQRKVSPRLRGWTRRVDHRRVRLDGLPAPAGMDPWTGTSSTRTTRSPRACGDGPEARTMRMRDMAVSPRLRGWTVLIAQRAFGVDGLPAPAGMDP